MECLLCDDYEQGLALRDYLVPHAVRWYTGDACDDEDDDDEEDDDKEDDEEEEDEEDDEKEDEEEEEACVDSDNNLNRTGQEATVGSSVDAAAGDATGVVVSRKRGAQGG